MAFIEIIILITFFIVIGILIPISVVNIIKDIELRTLLRGIK